MTRLLVLIAIAACSTATKVNAPPPTPTESAPPATNDPGALSPPIQSGAIDPLPAAPAPAPTATPMKEKPAPTTAATGSKADGTSCLDGGDCSSGVCEGEGCGADKPGTCMPRARRCTRDLRQYCGCDGKTFQTSGTCPGKRFSGRGQCVK